MQSRRGHIAALSGDGGLEQMGWLNQGESAGLDVHLYVSIYLSMTFTRGRFMSISVAFACICKYWKRSLNERQPESGVCHY